jgi:hypothetical protein
MLDTAKNLLLKELNLAPEVKDVINSDAEIKAIFGIQ